MFLCVHNMYMYECGIPFSCVKLVGKESEKCGDLTVCHVWVRTSLHGCSEKIQDQGTAV